MYFLVYIKKWIDENEGARCVDGRLRSTRALSRIELSFLGQVIRHNCYLKYYIWYTHYNHGIGVVTINNEDRLFVFGGEDRWYGIVASVEVYDVKTERWETTGSKLNKEKSDFGFLTVNLAQIQNL